MPARECTWRRKTQLGRHFGQSQTPFSQVVLQQVSAQRLQEIAEGHPLLGQSPLKCSPRQAKASGDLVNRCQAMRQKYGQVLAAGLHHASVRHIWRPTALCKLQKIRVLISTQI